MSAKVRGFISFLAISSNGLDGLPSVDDRNRAVIYSFPDAYVDDIRVDESFSHALRIVSRSVR
jgi:hypothetical protein